MTQDDSLARGMLLTGRTLRRLWQSITSLRKPHMKKDDTFARGQIATGQLLAMGTLRGLWTLEDFDHPPRVPQDVRSINVRSDTPWRNLAREWIAANPKEWELMMRDSLNAETTAPL